MVTYSKTQFLELQRYRYLFQKLLQYLPIVVKVVRVSFERGILKNLMIGKIINMEKKFVYKFSDRSPMVCWKIKNIVFCKIIE